jgi:cysteine-rich repeat protein
VTARWPACHGARAVRLRARLSKDCSLLDGVVRGKGLPRTTFRAGVSTCGDGIVDAGGGERCDDGDTLGGDTCEPTCVPCDPSSDPLASTWAGVQENVFTRYGCPICHGVRLVSGGLDLRPDVALGDLIGVRSSGDPDTVRIVPGDPADSMLWKKLAKGVRGGFDDVPGDGMPFGGRITPEELDAVGNWILDGAPATGVVPGTELLLMRCRPR